MAAQLVNIVGVEGDVGIDPHQFVESLGESVAGHLVACGVDGGVAAHTPDGIAASLQFAERVVATGFDGAADGHENDATRLSGTKEGLPTKAERVLHSTCARFTSLMPRGRGWRAASPGRGA